MANNVEIELKFSLRNPADIIAFLDQSAQQKTRNIFQHDTYYTPAHRDFTKPGYIYEWLRIRESDKGTSINYKHFHPENAEVTDYCDEYETTVGDTNQLKRIFAALDVKEVVVVEKYRSTWDYKDSEIAIDDVTDLGSFIELEAQGSFDNPRAGKDYLRSILTDLHADIGAEDLRGYPFMLLARTHQH